MSAISVANICLLQEHLRDIPSMPCAPSPCWEGGSVPSSAVAVFKDTIGNRGKRGQQPENLDVWCGFDIQKKIQRIAYHPNLIDLRFIQLLRKFSLKKFTNQLERIHKPTNQKTGKEQKPKLIFGQSVTSNVVSKLTTWTGAKSNHFIISIVWPGLLHHSASVETSSHLADAVCVASMTGKRHHILGRPGWNSTTKTT